MDIDKLFSMQQESESSDPLAMILAKGKQALASGQITPEQAMKNYQQVSPLLQQLGIGSDPLLNPRMPASIQDKKAQLATTGTVNMPTKSPAVYAKAVAKGSGRTESVENKNTTSDENTEQKTYSQEDLDKASREARTQQTKELYQYEPIEELQARYEGLRNTPMFKDRAQGISNMEDLLAMSAEAPSDIYSAPIAGLLQGEFGRNVSAMLAGRGASPEEQRQKMLGYKGKIIDDEATLNKEILQAAKDQRIGKTTDLTAEKLYQENMQKMLERYMNTDKKSVVNVFNQASKAEDPTVSGDGKYGRADLRIKEKDVRDSVNKTMENLDTAATVSKNITDNLSKNDYLGLVGSLSSIARNVGADKGALSDKDLKNYLPATFEGSWAKFEAYIDSNPNALVDPQLTAGLKKLAASTLNNLKSRYEAELSRKKKQYKASSSFVNVPVDEMFSPAEERTKEIDAHYKTIAPKEMVSVIAPDGRVGAIPKENLEAALKKGYKRSQ